MSKLVNNAQGNIEYHPHPEYLPASIPSDFLPPISNWLTLGGLFLSATVGVVIGLAAFTPYRATVKAPSRIRPVGGIHIIQSAISGKVKNIQVSDNQIVKKGDIIASLDNSELLLKINQLQGSIEKGTDKTINTLAEVAEIEALLKDTIIRSPVEGTIQQLDLRYENQVVEQGDLLARIVPSNSPLKIKAWFAPEDISKLEVGQQALMKVSACPYPDYGVLSGTVSTIAPDSIQKKSSSNIFTDVGFEVTIQPNNILMKSKKKQCKVQIGMEGRTEIVTQEETVLSFMLRKARILTNL